MVTELLINFERKSFYTVSHDQLLVRLTYLGWYGLAILIHWCQDGKNMSYQLWFLLINCLYKCLITNLPFLPLASVYPFPWFLKKFLSILNCYQYCYNIMIIIMLILIVITLILIALRRKIKEVGNQIRLCRHTNWLLGG